MEIKEYKHIHFFVFSFYFLLLKQFVDVINLTV